MLCQVGLIILALLGLSKLSYILGSAKNFDNLKDLGAILSVLYPTGLARARARLWLIAFSSPVN